MQCALNHEALLPSEYVEQMAEFMKAYHTGEIEAIMMHMDAQATTHYSVAVKCAGTYLAPTIPDVLGMPSQPPSPDTPSRYSSVACSTYSTQIRCLGPC